MNIVHFMQFKVVLVVIAQIQKIYLCIGKPYKIKQSLYCPYHALAFEIECLERASMSETIIHPQLGKVHINYLESCHSILIAYCSKDIALKKMHYVLSTNLGLLQANVSYMYSKKLHYSWILELYDKISMPVSTYLRHVCALYSESRHMERERQKTEPVVRRAAQKKHTQTL